MSKSWKIIAEDMITENIYSISRVSHRGCSGSTLHVADDEGALVHAVSILAQEVSSFVNETLVTSDFRSLAETPNGIGWSVTDELRALCHQLNSHHGLIIPKPTKYLSSKYSLVDLDLISLPFANSQAFSMLARKKGLISALVDRSRDMWRTGPVVEDWDVWNILIDVIKCATDMGICSGLGTPVHVYMCNGEDMYMFKQFLALQLGYYSQIYMRGDCVNDKASQAHIASLTNDIYFAAVSLKYLVDSYARVAESLVSTSNDELARIRQYGVRNVVVCQLTHRVMMRRSETLSFNKRGTF